MRYFDAFSGYGGFSLGIQKAYESIEGRTSKQRGESVWNDIQRSGDSTDNISRDSRVLDWTCVGFSEIDKYAIQIYEKHFPEHKNYGDLTKINAEQLPDFDLFVGGFPCQAFSIAGKRKGFDDTRGTLFFDIARILRAKRPRLLLLENVKGLLSHDNGKTFSTIISTLNEIGYDIQWQVLNAKHFGVPQNRERVFIIGHLRGTSRPQVFPIKGAIREDTKVSVHAEQRTKGIATRHLGRNGKLTSDIASTVQASETPHIVQINKPKHSNDRVYNTDGISPTLNTMQGGNRQPFIQQLPRGKNNGGEKSISPTVTVGSFQHNNFVSGIRRLTPTECERLMGLPDGWTEGHSDSQRYKLCGNGVVVNVVEEIIKRLITLN